MRRIGYGIEHTISKIVGETELLPSFYLGKDGSEALELQIGKYFELNLGNLRKGLKKAAEIIQNSEEMEKIKKVTGTSWMVTEHPKIFEKLGFVIDSESEESKIHTDAYKLMRNAKMVKADKLTIEPSYCYITKEKLIELYGRTFNE